MTNTRTPPAPNAVFQRHEGLIIATERALDGLSTLSPDASPQSFPALKATSHPEAGE